MLTAKTAVNGLSGLCLAALCIGVLGSEPIGLQAQTVPANLNLQNVTVATGTAVYEASSTINATTFVVGSRSTQASAYLQAGSSIVLQPGFHVFPGSTFYGYIAQPPTLQTQVTGAQTTGASGAQNITILLPDPEGPSAVAGGNINFLMTDANGNITQQCPIGFTVNPALVSLADATSSNQSMTLPGSGSISDSVCQIAAIDSSNPSISVGPNGVTVTVNLTFLAGSAGTYQLVANVYDGSGVLSPWATMGTWTVSNGDFSLSANPTTLSIGENGTATLNVSVNPINQFTGAVTLTPVPSIGVSVSPTSFDVNVPSAPSASFTVRGLAPGASSIDFVGTGTATGTSTVLTHQLMSPVAVTVTASQDFTLSQPSTMSFKSVVGSGSFNETVSAGATGFIGTVALSATSQPSGLSFSFSPSAPALSSSITSVVSAVTVYGTTAGVYTITVTGTPNNGGPIHSTSFQLMVLALPTIQSQPISGQAPASTWQTFALKFGDAAGAQAVAAGSLSFTNSALSPAAKCQIDFSYQTGTIALHDNGQSFTVPALSGVISNSTCSVQGAGTTFSVDSSGALNLALSISFSSSTAGTFAVVATVTDILGQASTAQTGSWTSVNTPVVSFGNAGAEIYLNTVTSLNFNITDALGAGAIPYALFTFSQTAADGSLVSDCALTFSTPPNYFGENYIPPGTNACQLSGYPAGAASGVGQNLALFFNTFFTYLGSYSVTVGVVDSDGLQAPVTEVGTLAVVPSANNSDFDLTLKANAYVLHVGTPGNYNGSINVTASCASPCSASMFSGYNPVTTSTDVPFSILSSHPGVYLVTFTGTDNSGRSHSVQTPFILPGPTPSGPGFTLSLPNPITVGQVTSGSSTLAMQSLNGFNSPVVLSASVVGNVPGLTASITPASLVGNGTATINVSSTSQTPYGIYSVTITGASTSPAQTYVLIQQVVVVNQQPPSFSFTGVPQSIFWYGAYCPQGSNSCSMSRSGGTVSFNNGWQPPVQLSAAFVNTGPGFAVTVAPTTVNSNASFNLNMTILRSLTVGSYPITITATSGLSTQTITTYLVVTQGNLALYSVSAQLSQTSIPALTATTLALSGSVASGQTPHVREGAMANTVAGGALTPEVTLSGTALYDLSTTVTSSGAFAGNPNQCLAIPTIASVAAGTPFSAPVIVHSSCPAGIYQITVLATPQNGGPAESATVTLFVGVPQKEYIRFGGRVIAIESR